ncbi:hypothetical protein AGR2A_pa60089 [Agrobacterium genomosp. 2 str. CFBP 5494]|uniref:Uncharacterized protein n=1 Tax=Agrobacterium genomosp. 2 str. CFBP 5494 TaxID=1183436 RepID=A0A9W5B7I5_9HYPH|nr:hypothetical protein AGR2A_pa60089 [Agrobacterium genomosp. 2 str. CFBP 5494]
MTWGMVRSLQFDRFYKNHMSRDLN